MSTMSFIKIGYTKELESRMTNFRVNSPITPVHILSISCESLDDAIDVEREFHSKYSGCCVNGEWFDSEPVLRDIVKFWCHGKKNIFSKYEGRFIAPFWMKRAFNYQSDWFVIDACIAYENMLDTASEINELFEYDSEYGIPYIKKIENYEEDINIA